MTFPSVFGSYQITPSIVYVVSHSFRSLCFGVSVFYPLVFWSVLRILSFKFTKVQNVIQFL